MNKKVNDTFMSVLKPYGALEWHKSKYNSYYIKFKDTRLGSIRIADHDKKLTADMEIAAFCIYS